MNNGYLRSKGAKSQKGNLREEIVHLLWEAMVDLVKYIILHAPVSDIINKLEIVYATIASFNILM